MRTKFLFVIALLSICCRSLIGDETVSEILSSPDDHDSKKQRISEIVAERFKVGEQLPKLAEEAILKSHFEIRDLPIFTGRLPFPVDLDDHLYVIAILPKTDGENRGIYFTLEGEISADDLVRLLSTDSSSTRKLKIVKLARF